MRVTQTRSVLWLVRFPPVHKPPIQDFLEVCLDILSVLNTLNEEKLAGLAVPNLKIAIQEQQGVGMSHETAPELLHGRSF